MSGKKSMKSTSPKTTVNHPKKTNIYSLLENESDEESPQNDKTTQNNSTQNDKTQNDKIQNNNNTLNNNTQNNNTQNDKTTQHNNILNDTTQNDNKMNVNKMNDSTLNDNKMNDNTLNDNMLNVSGDVRVSDFLQVNSRQKRDRVVKFDEKILENKQIYDENKNYGDIGNDLKLNSYWTVWIHKSDDSDWTLKSYQKKYIINSIGSFWRFFNNFQLYDCYKNQLFIMRGEIAPIWEDVNNKFGGICSTKVDSTQRGFKTDISTEIFITICMLIMNETFVANSEDINGISYSVKKRGTLIKLWTKTCHKDDKFINELPKSLFNKFNQELQKQLAGIMGDNYKMSIQYKQIKPEYDL